MTLETDALIGYFKASSVTGLVTDINTPHVHASDSYHYRSGSPSGVVMPLDRYGGREGQAVDFGLSVGRPDDPQYAKIFAAFAPVEYRLAEMFHSGPTISYFIKNGRRYPIAQLDPATRAAHHNHVHVAVEKGVYLDIPAPQPIPEGDDMAPEFKVTCPTGGYWIVRRADGAVYAYGPGGQTSGPGVAPFFGSMSGKAMNAPVVDLEPWVINDQVTGYLLTGLDGGIFAFGQAPYTDSYAAHPEWHGGIRVIVGSRMHFPGYDIVAVEPGTDPPKVDIYDLSIKR